MNHTLKAKLDPVLLLAPIAVSASGTSDMVDVQGANSVEFDVAAGDFAFDGSNKLDLLLGESDDGTTFTVVAGADMIEPENGTLAKSLDSTADKNAIHRIHYKGYKRYVQVQIVETGTVSVPLSIVAVKGHLEAMPPA